MWEIKYFSFILLLIQIISVNGLSVNVDVKNNETAPNSTKSNISPISNAAPFESLAQNNTGTSSTNAIVNTYILTLFHYENMQVYVYNPKSNSDENKHDYQKWIFYYVPVMLPAKRNLTDGQWLWTSGNEVRIRLILGNPQVEELARAAISNKFDSEIVKNYSKYWDIAPLMIDSLMAYIVQGDSSPIVGVQHYHAVHPTAMTMTLRFLCATPDTAQEVVKRILDGDYEIEVALYFAEFKQIKTNAASITADQVKSVLSKTVADGGGTNPEYIHRNQASKFIGKYMTNVKKMIYIEDASLNTSQLTAGLEEQFFSLFQKGMEESQQTILKAGAYDQIWSPSDLNPDRIETELSNLFSKNDTETEKRNNTNTYFNLNTQYLEQNANSNSASATISGSGWGFSAAISGSTSSASSNSLQNQLENTNHNIFSNEDVEKMLKEQQVTINWTGEKFVPKQFEVYKLTDLTNQLQVAIISKQLSVDKTRGALVRTINMLNTIDKPTVNNSTLIITLPTAQPTILTGTVQMYAGKISPPKPWLLCDGSSVSRKEYKRLFAVIGEIYGAGDGNTTFNIPDLRGRVPVGAHESRINRTQTMTLGSIGGQTVHSLTIDELPLHNHGAGSLATSFNGNHSHTINDPGHNHGGRTGSESPLGSGGWGMTRKGYSSDQGSHSHIIPTGKTFISLNPVAAHSHSIAGVTSSVGRGVPFSLMQPYQVINYIIYAA